MNNPTEEHFTKIVVDLPKADDGVGGEGLWTVARGEDLYEVRNSPWHSREINYLDVVKAIAPTPDKHPVFISVERRSGHRTVQTVILKDGKSRKDEFLKELSEFGATYEGAHSTLFALDFAPGVDWEPALNYLKDRLRENLVDHRTSAY